MSIQGTLNVIILPHDSLTPAYPFYLQQSRYHKCPVLSVIKIEHDECFFQCCCDFLSVLLSTVLEDQVIPQAILWNIPVLHVVSEIIS